MYILKSEIKKIKNVYLRRFKTSFKKTFYEYESASNPNLSKIPIVVFKNDLKKNSKNSTKIQSFDLSKNLMTKYMATTPNLLASFLNIRNKSNLLLKNDASSNFFYVISGNGTLNNNKTYFEISQGDIISMPFDNNGIKIKSRSNNDLILYHVNDSPLMNYLGVEPKKVIIPSTIYKKKDIIEFMDKINNENGAENRNRNGVLLSNSITDNLGTKTLTNILWSLYNIIKPNSIQKPHKHNSVALDLCTYAAPGKVYTLIGEKIDNDGNIINPKKVYWETNCVFVTPPGYWHSHVNESEEDAYVLPVQDAGLYTYQRTLDIQFVR